mmetsp:Transcript_14856/g.19197  ORF Transcript_14856/g.19197 Transcript_14856/m.19197 type:complete len:302 (-) Transcript_14856:164-1069(-)
MVDFVISGDEDLKSIPFGMYPCCLMKVRNLLELDSLITHEEALERGMLFEAVPNHGKEFKGGRGEGFFNVYQIRPGPNGDPERFGPENQWDASMFTGISHRWTRGEENPPHPDNENHDKLGALKSFCKANRRDDAFIWFDYFSVPQQNRENTKKAIASLTAYFMYVRNFISLVLDEDDLDAYRNRMWTRFEQVMSHIPVFFREGMMLGNADGKNIILVSHTSEQLPIKIEDMRNPFHGRYTVAEDRWLLKPLLAYVLDRFERYNKTSQAERYTSPDDVPEHLIESMKSWLDEINAELKKKT